MRLDILTDNLSSLQKFQMRLVSHMVGHAPGPIAVLSYRREWFGRHYNDFCQESLREMSAWSKAEAELFAAFVSRRNSCAYCSGAHKAIAIRGYDPDLVNAVLTDWRTAPVEPHIKATLSFLEKLTQCPTEVAPTDIDALYAVGLTRTAIEEAIHICFLFCMINRLADAFEFEVPSERSYEKLGFTLYNMGYGLGSLPG